MLKELVKRLECDALKDRKQSEDDQRTIEQLSEKIQSEKSLNAEFRCNLKAARKDIKRLEEESKKLNKNLQLKINLINELENSNSTFKRQLGISESERSALAVELSQREEVAAELEAKQHENRELTKSINRLNRDLSDFQIELSLQNEAPIKKSRMRKVVVSESVESGELAHFTAKITKLKQQLSNESNQKKKSKRQLKDSNETIKKLRLKIKTKIADIKELKEKCSMYRNKNLRIEKEFKIQKLNYGHDQVAGSSLGAPYDHDDYLNYINKQLSSQIENNTKNREIIRANRKLSK